MAASKSGTKSTVNNGVYPKGQETVAKILRAAEKILIEEGYRSLSFRKIAAEAGITAGNLQYYFPSKDELIKTLLDTIIELYIDFIETRRHTAGSNPDEQFADVVEHLIQDLNLKKTTHFFPELWALANHDDHVAEMLEGMYQRYRAVMQEIIEQMNPALSKPQARKLALFITSSIEGHTMFIGHDKRWKKDTKDIARIAVLSFTHVVHNPPS